jgi:hypothetical protein
MFELQANYKSKCNMKIEYDLVEKIYDLIENFEFLKHPQVNSDGD